MEAATHGAALTENEKPFESHMTVLELTCDAHCVTDDLRSSPASA
jgi:hypothetical protein